MFNSAFNWRNFLITSVALSLLVCSGVGVVNSANAYRGDWHRGHWVHDRHGGRLGWWWVIGPSWYFYPRPYNPSTVIVEPAPQQTIVQQAPPVVVQQAPPQAPVIVQQPVLYYCKATGTHYPETMSCPGGWTTMTATTPPEPTAPPPPQQ